MFRPMVLSKNHTAEQLRRKHKLMPLRPYKSVVRLGSVTEVADEHLRRVCNSSKAGKNSSNKLVMKSKFAENDVKQAEWYTVSNVRENLETWEEFPLVAKIIMGKKAQGMVKIENAEELNEFLNRSDINFNKYYFEKFYNYAREYRVHTSVVTPCFMSWRKLRRNDSEERWYFNNDNCNWVSPEHELYDEPSNMAEVIENCHRALKAVGLDIGACDVRIQSSKKETPEFIICEVNSGPSLGETGIKVYADEIIKVLDSKK